MKVELEEHGKNGGGITTVNYDDNRLMHVIENGVPKTDLQIFGKSFTLTEWNKDRKILHYKQVENSMQRKVG